MSFIWFLVALTFFILWRNAKKVNREESDAAYQRGYQAGKFDGSLKISKKQKIVEPEAEDEWSDEPFTDSALFDTTVTPEDVSVRQRVATAKAAHEPYVAMSSRKKRTKEQQANRNLNILLYAASFLIIAAAAAFIATSMPAGVRLTGLWLVIAAFYVAGIWLYKKVAYLKPAATAFVGTGLAIVPFAGIALSQLGGLSEGWAWAITSIVGVLSFGVATVVLTSNIVAYLTIAFSLSFAASTIAVIDGPSVLYFVALIIVSLIFHVLAHVKSEKIPALFKRPIEQTGHLLTPMTLVGSLFAYNTMTLTSYQVVLWVATLYYVVIFATRPTYLYETAVRILVSIASFVSILDLVNLDVTASIWAAFAILMVQGVYSFVRVVPTNTKSVTAEKAWYWLIVLLASYLLLFWVSTTTERVGIVTTMSGIGILSVLMAVRLRIVWLGIPALVMSVLLPFAIGRWPSHPTLSFEYITYIFLGLAALALVAFQAVQKQATIEVRRFLQGAFWTYAFTALSISMAQATVGAFSISTALLAGLVLVASYWYNQWQVEGIAAALVIPAVIAMAIQGNVPFAWSTLIVVATIAGVYLVGVLAHHVLGETTRRSLLVVFTFLVGFGLLFSATSSDDEAKIISGAVAIIFAAVALALQSYTKDATLKTTYTASYGLYPVVGFLANIGLSTGWFTLFFLATTVIYWIANYLEKNRVFLVLANVATASFITTGWVWLHLDSTWQLFGVAWLSALVYFATYFYYISKERDGSKWLIQLASTWITLGIPMVTYVGTSTAEGIGSAWSIVAIGATIVVHGKMVSTRRFIEIGIYAITFGLQRLVAHELPDLSIVVYGHWWAAIVAAVAYWRRDEPRFMTRLIWAMVFITGSTGLMALGEGGGYQLLFLVEHVALLVVGALWRKSWALWWGLAATILAVLYFLKSSLFLSLLFLGLTLLGIVIWRLRRSRSEK